LNRVERVEMEVVQTNEICKPDFTHEQRDQRLDVLKRYVSEHPRTMERGHINLHVHTNESFSFFQNPTEAVWYAYVEGIEYFGINDHYTINGHEEFRSACGIASMKSTYSIEAIAMDDESLREDRRYNDPTNAGRCYLVGKGVTRDVLPGSRGYSVLWTMRDGLRKRNEKIIDKLNAFSRERGVDIGLSYDAVEALTPDGNCIERHVVQAFCERIASLFPDLNEREEIYNRILGSGIARDMLLDPAELQTLVRARLVKSGKPCYVEENRDAFTTVDNLVNMYLEYGAIPIYPMMGNPVTEEEMDLVALFRKMQTYRLHALEIIDYRTEISRAQAVFDAASSEGYPVFVGTEHNTKKALSLVGPVASHPAFYDYLRRSAHFVMGHQRLMQLCDFGAVYDDGRPRFDSRIEGFRFFENIGEMDISEELMDELKQKTVKERKVFFGI
jgi:hypothetical protein